MVALGGGGLFPMSEVSLYGTVKTVNAVFWPWLSGPEPLINCPKTLTHGSLFTRKGGAP